MRSITIRSFSSLAKPKPLSNELLKNLNSPENKAELEKFHMDYNKYYTEDKETTGDILRDALKFTLFLGGCAGVWLLVFTGPELYRDWRLEKVRKMRHQIQLDDLQMKIELQKLKEQDKEKKD